jgi:hypothetical protein
MGCSSSSTSSQVEKMTLMPGNNVSVNKDCFGAISKEAFDRLADYTASQNVPAADKMRQAGLLVVLKIGDKAELEEVTMGYVKMKILSGILSGRSVYTFREMVDKAGSTNAQSGTKAANQTQSSNSTDTSNTKANDEQRKTYRDWTASIDNKISNYPELDNKALKIIADFKAKNISKSSKGSIEKTWGEMDSVRMSLLGFQTPDSLKVIYKDIWKISGEYCSGVNDRQAALWKIIEYCDGAWRYEEAIGLVDDCVKSSNESFDNAKKTRAEFDKVFK